MKNLHLIQTDKPSRLFDDGMQLYLGELEDRKGHPVTSYNIYITSDEEIKEGDWCYQVELNDGKVDKCYDVTLYHTWTNNGVDKTRRFKKIILTTDQELIKDGVQAINDEFLEWFEKNPSCKEVEVGYGWIRLTETDNEGYWVSIPDKQFEMQQEEPKQETLEEAAEKYAKQFDYAEDSSPQVDFIEGAKWQAERMYSEEEVIKIVEKSRETGLTAEFLLLTEQFKKK